MSHAEGEIIKDGQTIAWYEYDGTADVLISAIYKTREEMSTHWRQSNFASCTCGQRPTPVQIYSDYGGGFWWNGSVCLDCMCITSPICNWEDEEGFEEHPGHPIKGPDHDPWKE